MERQRMTHVSLKSSCKTFVMLIILQPAMPEQWEDILDFKIGDNKSTNWSRSDYYLLLMRTKTVAIVLKMKCYSKQQLRFPSSWMWTECFIYWMIAINFKFQQHQHNRCVLPFWKHEEGGNGGEARHIPYLNNLIIKLW